MLSYRSRWWLSRSLPTIASASASVRFLIPCWVFRWNLTQERLIFGIDQAEGVAAKTVHMAVGIRNTAVAHDDGHLVQCFRKRSPEIPVVFGTSHVGARVTFDGMVEVGEFKRVTQEEDRGIVADQVPVAFFGVELHGKTADIAFGIGRAAFTGHGGKAHKQVGLFTNLRKRFWLWYNG